MLKLVKPFSKYFVLLGIVFFSIQDSIAQVKTIQKRNPWQDQTMVAKQNSLLKKILKNSSTQNSASQRSGNNMDQLPTNARFAAQYEENQAIVMTWSYEQEIDTVNIALVNLGISPDTLLGKVSCDLADAIQRNALVIIRVNDFSDTATILKMMVDRGTPLYNYRFYELTVDAWWDRDSGPVCFYYGKQDSIGILDMDYYTNEALEFKDGTIFTNYNEINRFNRIHDDSIPIVIGKEMNYKVFKTKLNNEGGNLIFDGLGSTWSSTRTREQNVGTHFAFVFDTVNIGIKVDSNIISYGNYPALNDTEYEQLFKNSYNTNNFIEPVTLDCDGGTGHLDIYLKLFDDNKLGYVDYSNAPGHSDYSDWATNISAFKVAVDNNDKPYDLSIFPMPLTFGDIPQTECEIDQRTYINGIFVNKSFILPVQSDPAKGLTPFDKAAVKLFEKSLPGYTIIPIDSKAMYGTGGALHCITHEIPAENPLFIRHKSLTGTQKLENNYYLTAQLINKSGIKSANAYYRKSGETNWQTVNLIGKINDNYDFTIPNINFTSSDTIEYFIEAISNNGKIMTKPFTAREGGFWKFYFKKTVSTSSIDELSGIIYPNPSSSGMFLLKNIIDETSEGVVSVSNSLGQIVLSQKLSISTLDLTTVQSGMYFANIQVNGKFKVIKLIKL
jgi:agmatine/peptidylarginine deiminase